MGTKSNKLKVYKFNRYLKYDLLIKVKNSL